MVKSEINAPALLVDNSLPKTHIFLLVNPLNGRRMSGIASKSLMDKRQENHMQRWWMVMLRDPHWWVPVTVLVGGLILLQWIR